LLDIRERSWRPRADATSVAAETLDEIPLARREQALAALGSSASRWVRSRNVSDAFGAGLRYTYPPQEVLPLSATKRPNSLEQH